MSSCLVTPLPIYVTTKNPQTNRRFLKYQTRENATANYIEKINSTKIMPINTTTNSLSPVARLEKLYPNFKSRFWKYQAKAKTKPKYTITMSFEFTIGCLETFLAVLLFGSTYVPVKRLNAHDGVFVLFLLAISTFMVGCVASAIQGFEPKIYPLALFSGCIWTIGNTAVIPIIKRIGLALGYLIWNTTNCIVGWGITYFGLFGVSAKPATIPLMNFVGVGIVMIGGVIFTFVDKAEEEIESNVNASKSNQENMESLPIRFPGIAMAAIAGCLFGAVFLPIFYMQDNPEKFDNTPRELPPYLFSQYLGILITATLEFAVYSIIRKNKPKINPQIVLPSFATGIIFGTGQVLMFGATQILTASIAFPIVAMMHGLVAASWSIFYFKEIKGTRNYILMGIAVCVNLTGSTLIALSK